MRAIVIAIGLLASGCTTASQSPPELTVAEFYELAPQLVGQTVTIVGFVEPCVPLGCAITAKPSGGDNQVLSISIGTAPSFDRAVRHLGGRQIRMRATFTGRCFDFDPNDDVIVVCADRGNSLAEPEFLGVMPAQKD